MLLRIPSRLLLSSLRRRAPTMTVTSPHPSVTVKKRSASPTSAPAAATFSSSTASSVQNPKRPKVDGEEGDEERKTEVKIDEEEGPITKQGQSDPSKLALPPRAPLQTADSFDHLDAEAEALIAAAEAVEERGPQSNCKPMSSIKQPTPSLSSRSSSSSSAPTTTTPNDPFALERSTMDPQWFARLEPEMRKPTFRALKNFLEAEKKQKQTVYPPEKLIHSWSRLTPLDKVKVVVVGQDPYHGPGQACGMSFSVPKGVPVPGSLKNIYKELTTEYPGKFQAPNHGNLESWASQGVLLLNASLTVRAGQAASHHGKGWEPFTRAILELVKEEALHGTGSGGAGGASTSAQSSKLMGMFKKQGATLDEPSKPPKVEEAPVKKIAEQQSTPSGSKGVVFLSWGLPAAKTLAEAGITEKTSPNILLLKSPHPSPLSAHRGFLGNGHFKKANEWLEAPGRYGKGGGIQWEKL